MTPTPREDDARLVAAADYLIDRLRTVAFGKTPVRDLTEAEEWWKSARAAALRETGTEPGWQVVPVEPTPEMIDAGSAWMDGGVPDPDYDEDVRDTWTAMLAAAPSPHTPDGGERHV